MCISSGMSLSKLEFNTARKSQALFKMFSYELTTIRKGRARSATLLIFITRMGKQLPCYGSLSPLDMQQDRGY